MMFKSRQHTQMTDQCLVEEIRGGCCVDNLSPLTDPFCTITSWHRKPLHITGPLRGVSISLTLCEGNLPLHYLTGGLENQNFEVSFILSSKKPSSWCWFWAPWLASTIRTLKYTISHKKCTRLCLGLLSCGNDKQFVVDLRDVLSLYFRVVSLTLVYDMNVN